MFLNECCPFTLILPQFAHQAQTAIDEIPPERGSQFAIEIDWDQQK
jgi:hypothetical protein